MPLIVPRLQLFVRALQPNQDNILFSVGHIITMIIKDLLKTQCRACLSQTDCYNQSNRQYVMKKAAELRRLPACFENTSILNTFDVFVQHVINHRINVLVHIFEQNREAIFDGQLQLF